MFLFFKKLFSKEEEKSVISQKNNIIFSNNNDDLGKFNARIEQGWKLNQKGIEYERNGDIDNAIICYEENLKDEFEGAHPYKRLAIIYRGKKDYTNEIRVLEQAIRIYHRNQQYNVKTYEQFKNRLIKAKLLKDKTL